MSLHTNMKIAAVIAAVLILGNVRGVLGVSNGMDMSMDGPM